MSSADILAYDNCTVNSFNFANFIKVKNKNLSLNCIPSLVKWHRPVSAVCTEGSKKL